VVVPRQSSIARFLTSRAVWLFYTEQADQKAATFHDIFWIAKPVHMASISERLSQVNVSLQEKGPAKSQGQGVEDENSIVGKEYFIAKLQRFSFFKSIY